MIKLKNLLNEGVDFKVVVNDRKGKLIQGGNFSLKDDAKLYIKDMMKKGYKQFRYKGEKIALNILKHEHWGPWENTGAKR